MEKCSWSQPNWIGYRCHCDETRLDQKKDPSKKSLQKFTENQCWNTLTELSPCLTSTNMTIYHLYHRYSVTFFHVLVCSPASMSWLGPRGSMGWNSQSPCHRIVSQNPRDCWKPSHLVKTFAKSPSDKIDEEHPSQHISVQMPLGPAGRSPSMSSQCWHRNLCQQARQLQDYLGKHYWSRWAWPIHKLLPLVSPAVETSLPNAKLALLPWSNP